jgi:hypothetical protein
MPIRFRCVFCNQLMGISRRKAGTVVRCPVCASPVTVPAQAEEEAVVRAPKSGKARPAPEPAPPIFERSDFDEAFNPSLKRAGPERSAPEPRPFEFEAAVPPPLAVPEKDDALSEAAPSVGQAAGLVVTRKLAMRLGVAAVAALALAFALGLWLGQSWRS